MSDLQVFTAVVVFVLAVFGVYRLLVQQKDANIQVLRDQLAVKDIKIQDLESQGPDALVNTLSKRIDVAIAEIARLNADKEQHASELAEKHADLSSLQDRLKALTALISDSDLLCPTCGAPLMQRLTRTVHGPDDQDTEVEFVEYGCGYAEDEYNGTVTPCPHEPNDS